MTSIKDYSNTSEAKEWLATLIGNAPFGIIALDVAGYCILINARAARVFGSTAENLIDCEISDLLVSWPELAEAMPNVQSGGRVNFDCVQVSRSNHVYSVSGRIIVSGMLLTINDISQQVRIQEQQQALLKSLESANSELADFAYICAHDMKSPVSNVIGLIEALNESEDLPEEASSIVELMRRSAESLNKTVCSLNQVLALRQTLGESTEYANVGVVLEDAINSLSPSLTETQAHLQIDVPEDLELRMQSVHLKSILQNLLGNAIKYRDEHRPPEVEIRISRTDASLVIEVVDNGMGLDVEKAGKRLFGLFNRFHSHVDGSGIGLYLTRSIVESYQGRIAVHSVKGQGSRFTVELPGLAGECRHAA